MPRRAAMKLRIDVFICGITLGYKILDAPSGSHYIISIISRISFAYLNVFFGQTPTL